MCIRDRNKGLEVASFKCGPDYIDPMFHTKVIGTKSRNLDTFFTEPDITCYLLERNSRGCDIAVMEGVMGYYDGVGGTTVKASAYDLARITKTPVVLIVNCKGMSVSILPYIKGFVEFQPDSQIQGVLLNQMSSMLYPRVKNMIEEQLHIKVYGYLPRVEAVSYTHLDVYKRQFLTLGDPTVYSTYLYVHKRILEKGYEAEIVSGITSFCAVAARLNMGLVEMAEPLHVLSLIHI